MTEREVLEQLERAPIQLHPLKIARVHVPNLPNADVVYDISWEARQGFRFIGEVKARATSQFLAAASQRAKSLAFDAPGSFPLVIVPYLSPTSVDEVEKLGISAIDLCGNGIVQVPHHWLVVRAGSPNRFRGSEPLRSAYRGVASLVARAFMVQSTFARVSDIRTMIEGRGGRITLATVSKALAFLEEDLVIAREAKGLRLLQPDKLLSKLRSNYQPPSIRARLAVKAKLSDLDLHHRLRRATESLGGRLVLTGISSASRQAVLASEPVTSFYCEAWPEDLAKAASIDPSPQRHFADLELLQTNDERVYFDARDSDARMLSSPVQTWLELATGDKRSQEVAEDLCARLLREIGARPIQRGDHG